MDYAASLTTALVKKIQSCKKNLQQGVSLIEAVMALALSAIVIAGVILCYQSAYNNQKKELTIAMLINLLSVVQSTYASQSGYRDITSDLIAGTGLLPAPMVRKESNGVMSIHTPAGYKVNIRPGKITASGASDYFIVDFPVERKMCSVMAGLKSGNAMSLFAIGKKLIPDENKSLSVALLQTLCDTAEPEESSGDLVRLYYKFH